MIQDLGDFNSATLIFGGPFSNLEATEAVFRAARCHRIGADRMICTGDIAAVCADPHATSSLIRESGIAVVMGNCEESFGVGAADCGCGFEDDSICDRLALQWFSYTQQRLDQSTTRWMSGLPRRLDFTMAGHRLAVIHGAVSSINGFVFESSAKELIVREVELADVDGVIGGHTGLPFTRMVEGHLWHNAGVIGLPANDGTPRVWYSLMIPEGNTIRIETRALHYDHATTAAKMRHEGLPEAYAGSLLTGLWPSMEYLPNAEAAAQGRSLVPTVQIWSTSGDR